MVIPYRTSFEQALSSARCRLELSIFRDRRDQIKQDSLSSQAFTWWFVLRTCMSTSLCTLIIMSRKHASDEMSTCFDFSLSCVYCLYHAGQPSSRPCLRQSAGLNSHFAVIEEIKANNTVPVVKPLHDGPYFVPLASILISLFSFALLLSPPFSKKHEWALDRFWFFSTLICLWLYHAGQPLSWRCLRRETGLNSQFAEIDGLKSNKTVEAVKPIRDGPYLWPRLSSILMPAGISNFTYWGKISIYNLAIIYIYPLT
jgi:hypothetical protein